MTQPLSGILTCNSQPAKNPNAEFFKGIMRDSGIRLSANDDPNVLTQEQALVVRDIDKLLDLDLDKNIKSFHKGFRSLVKKEKYLKKALLPTLFKKQGQLEYDIEIQQESLFRIFLKVDRLQSEIIEIILDELTSTVSDETHDVSRLRLLLGQLRYLPHIKDPKSLTTKLLDIIDVASYPSQLEIIDSIPDVLPDSEYAEAAQELMKMLDKNDELAGAIIDCLNAISLNAEIRAHTQDHILSKILTGTSTKLFPVFLDFLMSDCTARTLPGTFTKIRNPLNVILSTQDRDDEEKQSSKIVVFNRLQKTAVSKIGSESWLSVISNIKTHVDHKPVDLIILFMLHSSTKLKKRTIETTIRKRVKDGQFKCTLLEQVFEKYLPQQLLRDYFTSIMEIGSSLLRGSEDPLVTEFASTLFKLLFCHEYTERTFRQEILQNMILLVGVSDQKNVTAILDIIMDLIEDIAKAPNHAIILMRLLEKLDRFELYDVRLVFEILCRLTCYDEALQGLKEELHMIVRKHLTSAKRTSKFRGILSAVVMAKHLATNLDDQSDNSLLEESISSINQMRGPAREAVAILELTNTSASECPELVGLYYDQLGSVLAKSEHLDRHFLAWLHESVTNDFQNLYLTETVCEDVNDLQFSLQYNLNSPSEVEEPLAINIAELTLKPQNASVLVLAPHFRLLRYLHYKQYNGDLSSIDALLGYGVIVPKFDQRDSLGIEQLKQMTDCLFHCINWFRETISGFAAQRHAHFRSKILQRVDNLHELEELLNECLGDIPNHRLPQSYFDPSQPTTNKSVSPIKLPKAPRKKLKTKQFVEDTTAAPSTSVGRSPKKIREEHSFNFREIDIDLVTLLKYPLDPDEIDSEDQITLNLNQLNFILRDYVTKLTLLIKKRDVGLSHLNSVVTSDVITDCSKIVVHLNAHFKVILKRLDQQQDQDDDDNINKSLRTSFGLILQCLCSIFSWSGFQHSKRLDLLRDILKGLRSQETSTPLNSVNHLTLELVDRLEGYTDYCSTLVQAVDLVKTMEALCILSSNQSIRTKIAKTAGKLLNKKWDAQSSMNIDVLMQSYLSSATIKAICGMVGTLQDEASNLVNKTDTLHTLKSVTKANFYILYRNLWGSLHDRIKSDILSMTNAQHLSLWRTAALTMQGLMTIVKAQESRLNLVCFLKKSIAILKIFLSHGIPILEIELRSEPDRVVEILKTIQSNTRFLHHLCCHSKVNKDASLMSHVPQFRLTVETLVYRVKAALVANGCSAAFWMGNLKNKDLQGEDILTQSTDNSRNDDEEEADVDEEMPSDDELDEDESAESSEVFG